MLKKLLTLLLISIFALGVFKYFSDTPLNNSDLNKTTVKELKTDLTITVGDEIKIFDISKNIGLSALEATKSVATIKTTGTGENAFVTTIDEGSADSKKREFWELLINDKPSEVGAGSYIVQAGDKLKWQLSSY